MPNIITNRLTLHGTEQEKINEVFAYLEGEESEMDFNKIIPMPLELRGTESSTLSEKAWYVFQAKGLGNFERIDDMLTRSWVKEEGIKTREGMIEYLERRFIKHGHPQNARFSTLYDYGKHIYGLQQKYGFRNWYEWSVANWKVKWNAFDVSREENVIEFFTAWAGVPNLMLKASEMFPEVTFSYEFADELFGYNLGRYVFRAGEVVSEYEPEDFSVEAKILAKEILGYEEGESEE